MIDNRPQLSLIEECFPGFKSNVLRCEMLGFPWSSRPFIKESNGEVVSHVGFLEIPMLIDGRQTNIGALHAICTKVTHRRQGLATRLIEEALRWTEDRYELVVLFTEIPQFYQPLSFHCLQEYRFHLPYKHRKGTQPLTPVVSPQNDAHLHVTFATRTPISDRLSVLDNGLITTFNALFATYPTYWSIHYSAAIDAYISFTIQQRTLHLHDVIATNMPSLDAILDHLPTDIDDVYFYFPPDRLTNSALPERHLYDQGHFMVRGTWPLKAPFMIPPLSRC